MARDSFLPGLILTEAKKTKQNKEKTPNLNTLFFRGMQFIYSITDPRPTLVYSVPLSLFNGFTLSTLAACICTCYNKIIEFVESTWRHAVYKRLQTNRQLTMQWRNTSWSTQLSATLSGLHADGLDLSSLVVRRVASPVSRRIGQRVRHRRSWFYILFSSFFLKQRKENSWKHCSNWFLYCKKRLMQMALKSDLRCDVVTILFFDETKGGKKGLRFVLGEARTHNHTRAHTIRY